MASEVTSRLEGSVVDKEDDRSGSFKVAGASIAERMEWGVLEFKETDHRCARVGVDEVV